jgi:YD repeat-containing protein
LYHRRFWQVCWPPAIPQSETANYTYDIAGDPAIFTHFNGIITTYTYDAAKRLLGMGSIVSNYQFTLDEDGNRIHSSETEPVALLLLRLQFPIDTTRRGTGCLQPEA